MAEDETAIYRVTGLGFDSGDFVATHDCVLAESTTTTVPDTVEGSNVARAATLPRTGASSTLPLSTMAGLLLMTGGLLLALANKPLPTTATANTRSRGRRHGEKSPCRYACNSAAVRSIQNQTPRLPPLPLLR
jgi:LPXTG-motif cell wall-anchored protein